MKKCIPLLVAFCCLFVSREAFAKVWRVNNTSGISANFTDLPAAITAASAGDTIYVEGSLNSYSSGTLAKKLVIIGPGYFLVGNPVNPNTQFIADTATVPEITCQAGSAGSVIEGMTLSEVVVQDALITIQRNIIGSFIELGFSSGTNNTLAGDTIRQNYVNEIIAGTTGVTVTNLMVYNNIMTTGVNLTQIIGTASGYIINNSMGGQDIGAPTFNVENFVFQNNILYSPNFSTFIASNVYFNNISTNAVIPSGNGNVNNATFSTLYLGGISTGLAQGPSQLHTQDSAWMLAATSPAIGAGALNGTTVDCGAFGGPAPYVLSGMSPGIPSIYALTAPVQVNSGTASINVTISAASH
jgi:hypothetical protein